MAEILSYDPSETHFNITSDDRSIVHVATDDPVFIRRLESIGATLVRTRGDTKFYTFPANQMTLRNKREYTDEQKAAQVEKGKTLAALRKQAVQP